MQRRNEGTVGCVDSRRERQIRVMRNNIFSHCLQHLHVRFLFLSYEYDLMMHLEKLVAQCDATIAANKARIEVCFSPFFYKFTWVWHSLVQKHFIVVPHRHLLPWVKKIKPKLKKLKESLAQFKKVTSVPVRSLNSSLRLKTMSVFLSRYRHG